MGTEVERVTLTQHKNPKPTVTCHNLVVSVVTSRHQLAPIHILSLTNVKTICIYTLLTSINLVCALVLFALLSE